MDFQMVSSMLWRVLFPFQICPKMRSLMLKTMTNTSHLVKGIQESNGLVLTLFFSMTLMLSMVFVEIQSQRIVLMLIFSVIKTLGCAFWSLWRLWRCLRVGAFLFGVGRIGVLCTMEWTLPIVISKSKLLNWHQYVLEKVSFSMNLDVYFAKWCYIIENICWEMYLLGHGDVGLLWKEVLPSVSLWQNQIFEVINMARKLRNVINKEAWGTLYHAHGS